MDGWQDAPESSVILFDGTHENPSLIWTDKVRENIKSSVNELRHELYEKYVNAYVYGNDKDNKIKGDSDAARQKFMWTLPEDPS